MRVDEAEWQDLPADHQGDGDYPHGLPPEEPPKRRRWRLRYIFAGILAFFLLIIGWLAVTAPLSKSLQPIAAPSLTLVSAEGEPIARRGADIREPVDVSELPPHVPAAFIAIEDKRYYDHLGISLRGIARAAWRNLGAGGVREGGSTITQQLAKISFLSHDRTAARKAQEALIAFWLEAWLTKEEILERYLSNVYLGDNVYGLRAAAHHYFSIPPEKLTVPQAAMLAGMVKAPSRLAPTNNYERARQRGRVVIAQMIEQGYLTRAEANKLKPARLKVEKHADVPTGTYFADWVLPAARNREEIGYGAQTIQTTLEARLQKIAQRTVRNAGLGGAQVALVAMRPDGRVVAMVGGKDYAKSAFNRATQAKRQPGSAFKLFVWLAALRAGMEPEDTVADTPLTLGEWSPQNYEGRYRGTLTLEEALAVSSNVGSVRLAQRVGMENVVQAARDLGVRSPLRPHPSLALGTSGVTLLELTAAYAAVAAGEYPIVPRGLETEERPWWRRMWDSSVGGATGDANFDELRQMLGAVVERGTGRGAALAVPAFGKTGTSQDSRDAVFVGFAEDLVVGVWIGNDDNSPLGRMAGGGLPARIWRDFMAAALDTEPVKPQAAPIAAPVQTPDANGAAGVPIDGAPFDPYYDPAFDPNFDPGFEGVPPPQPAPGGGPIELPTEVPPPERVPTLRTPPPAPAPKEEPAPKAKGKAAPPRETEEPVKGDG